MKYGRFIIAGFIAFCFLSGSFSSAWSAERRKAVKAKKAVKTIQTKKKNKKSRVRLPDLIVQDIRILKDCEILVTIKNIGTAGVPADVYRYRPRVIVQMYKNGRHWGGMALAGVDKDEALRRPGGTASWVWFSGTPNLMLDGGTHSIKVVVDDDKELPELNERNNALTRRLRCLRMSPIQHPGKPDLVVRNISLIKDCKIKVTLQNIGTAGLPDWVYTNNNVGVQMHKDGTPWGGLDLRFFDPAGALKTPGGTVSKVWFPGAANLNLGPGLHSIKVHVDHRAALAEANEMNNKLTKRLGCIVQESGQTQRKPDLIVQDIRLVDGCKIKVTLKNAGTGSLPGWVYANDEVGVQMYRNGKPWGGVALRFFDSAKALKYPGGMASWIWFPNATNLKLGPGTHYLKAHVDHNAALPESNETNNKLPRRVRCE